MGHACAPAHAARWGLTHPLLPSCTGLSWADEGPGRGAFFSLPGTLRRQERGPRSSVGSCTVVGEEACHCRHGSSLSPGPPLSCLLCVARVTQGRVASLSLLLSRCTRLLWVVCLFSAPASHARMTPVASPGLFPEIQTRVPKWLRGIRARRRRPLGARPGLRPCPTARASCWGAVCSQARRPCHLPRAVGPSSSQPLPPLLSQPLLPEPRPPLLRGGGDAQPPHWFPPLAALQGPPHRRQLMDAPQWFRHLPQDSSRLPSRHSEGFSSLCTGPRLEADGPGPESRTSVPSPVEWHGQACLGARGRRTSASRSVRRRAWRLTGILVVQAPACVSLPRGSLPGTRIASPVYTRHCCSPPCLFATLTRLSLVLR